MEKHNGHDIRVKSFINSDKIFLERLYLVLQNKLADKNVALNDIDDNTTVFTLAADYVAKSGSSIIAEMENGIVVSFDKETKKFIIKINDENKINGFVDKFRNDKFVKDARLQGNDEGNFDLTPTTPDSLNKRNKLMFLNGISISENANIKLGLLMYIDENLNISMTSKILDACLTEDDMVMIGLIDSNRIMENDNLKKPCDMYYEYFNNKEKKYLPGIGQIKTTTEIVDEKAKEEKKPSSKFKLCGISEFFKSIGKGIKSAFEYVCSKLCCCSKQSR